MNSECDGGLRVGLRGRGDGAVRVVKVLVQNIRSIRKNLVVLESVLGQSEWDIIVLTETWIFKHEEGVHQLEGYKGFFVSNESNRSGGVAVYVRNTFPASQQTIHSKNCDAIMIQVQIGKVCLRVLGVYRSPSPDVSDCADFVSLDLSSLLAEFDPQAEALVCGDFNIDIGKPSAVAHDYLEQMAGFGFLLCNPAGQVTRPGLRGGTVVDHVFTRLNGLTLVGMHLREEGISDHLACEVLLEIPMLPVPSRLRWNVDYAKLEVAVSVADWTPVLRTTDAPSACKVFIDQCRNIIGEATEIKGLSGKVKPTKEWMTPTLVRAVRKRQRLYRVWKRTRSVIDELAFRSYKNWLRDTLRTGRDKFYRSLLERVRGNSRETWAIVNRLFRGTRSAGVLDPGVVGLGYDAINAHFALAGSNTVERHRVAAVDSVSRLPDYSCPEFTRFLVPTIREIKKIVGSLKGGKAGGWDGITGKFLKLKPYLFATLIEHIVQLTFAESIFPASLKRAKLLPIHKGGSFRNVDNYRPISLLPTLDKIIEKIMAAQLVEHLETNRILSDAQFGFRKGRSCEQAASGFLRAVSECLDSGYSCVAIFLDLRKAFDTVNHERLINKLERVGLVGRALELLRSYLSGRDQIIVDKDSGVASKPCEVPCGVPQGSVLGPLLFIFYINDLLLKGDEVGRFCFADDLVLLVKAKDRSRLEREASRVLTEASEWLDDNGLVLNAQKTKSMVFSRKKGFKRCMNIRTLCQHASGGAERCMCPTIEEVDSFKYLGLTVQNDLKFPAHISLVLRKMRSGVAVINRLRNLSSVALRRIVYSSLCESHLMYMAALYGGAFVTHLEPLKRLQRKSIRAVAGVGPRANCSPIFKELGLLDFDKLYIKALIATMHNRFSELRFPSHQHATRFKEANKIFRDKKTLVVTERLPWKACQRVLNALPQELREALLSDNTSKKARKRISRYLKDLKDGEVQLLLT